MILTLFIRNCFEFKSLQHVREIEICFIWNQYIDREKKIRQIIHVHSAFKLKTNPDFASKYEKLNMILSADRVLSNCSFIKIKQGKSFNKNY